VRLLAGFVVLSRADAAAKHRVTVFVVKALPLTRLHVRQLFGAQNSRFRPRYCVDAAAAAATAAAPNVSRFIGPRVRLLAGFVVLSRADAAAKHRVTVFVVKALPLTRLHVRQLFGAQNSRFRPRYCVDAAAAAATAAAPNVVASRRACSS
jgi:hypothetical protein